MLCFSKSSSSSPLKTTGCPLFSTLCWIVSHGTGTLRCLQKEMATYRHWSVSLWWDPDDVSHCRILSPDKTEWGLISDEDAVSWLTSYGSWRAYEKITDFPWTKSMQVHSLSALNRMRTWLSTTKKSAACRKLLPVVSNSMHSESFVLH